MGISYELRLVVMHRSFQSKVVLGLPPSSKFIKTTTFQKLAPFPSFDEYDVKKNYSLDPSVELLTNHGHQQASDVKCIRQFTMKTICVR
jgi:hypothetical protein